MYPTREPRFVLIATSLILIVLLVFVLSFAAVFLISQGTSPEDPTPSSAAAAPHPQTSALESSPARTALIEPATPTVITTIIPRSVPAAVASRLGRSLLGTPLLVLLCVGSLLFVGAIVWRRLPVARPSTAGRRAEIAPTGASHGAVDGAGLHVLRRRQRVMYSTLAQRTGLSIRYLAEIEYGLRNPDRGDLERICLALAQEEE